MISEVDIRDWDKVDFQQFQPNNDGRNLLIPFHKVLEFVEQVEKIRDAQIRAARKHIPALFCKEEE